MMTSRKTQHRIALLALLCAAMTGAFSCTKVDPDEPKPVPDTKPANMQAIQGYSTEYVSYPLNATYEQAGKMDGLTLSTTVNVATATSNVVARWYRITDSQEDTEIFSETLQPSSGESDYKSTMSLTKEQFNEFFPSKKFKEHRFYCTFSLRSADKDVKSTVFTSDTMTIATALPADIMVLWVNTVNGEEPTCDYVSPPPGNNGAGIRNCTKVPGRLRVSLAGKRLYDSGDYVEDVSGMTLKIRGNTSAYASQKPYKIKLQKKKDLLFRDDEKKYNDKEWVLIRGNANLNTLIGLETTKYLGFSWVPAMQYVNVVVNDDYRGLYCLVESYKRNEQCRADITERGFLIEKDAYWWNEDLYFDTSGFPSNMKFTFKYPDTDEIAIDQLTYIQAYVNNAEKAIKDGTYEKYLDVKTFASWLLFHDIYATLDCAGSNLYLAKKDMTSASKLEMLSPWDFDSIYWSGSMTQTWSNQHNYGAFYFPALLRNSNKAFLNEYKAQWASVRGELPSYIIGKIDAFIEKYGDAIDESRKLNASRWGGSSGSVASDRRNLKAWMDRRVDFLDQNLYVLN